MIKRQLLTAVLITLLVGTVLLISANFSVGQNGTQVGGVLWDNTTWTAANSPYIITSTVQIPSNVTLTIQPGVTITASMTSPNDRFLFLLNGNISARGNANNMITINGNGLSFFSTTESLSDSFLDLQYCRIQNGQQFWQPQDGPNGHGHFNLTDSIISNLSVYSLAWYSTQDIFIERNVFYNTAGFSTWHSDEYPGNVYIKNNLFDGMPSDQTFVVENWANGWNKTVVTNNSFVNMSGVVLSLKGGYLNTGMNGTNNYWGTTNSTIITSMVHDNITDVTCASSIPYQPILTSPDPNAPTCIIASANFGGSISPSGITYSKYGDAKSFTATANSGYHLKDVTVNGVSIDALTAFIVSNITKPTTVTAIFAADPTPTPAQSTSNPTTSPTPTPPSTVPSSPIPTPIPSPPDDGNSFLSLSNTALLMFAVVAVIIVVGVIGLVVFVKLRK